MTVHLVATQFGYRALQSGGTFGTAATGNFTGLPIEDSPDISTNVDYVQIKTQRNKGVHKIGEIRRTKSGPAMALTWKVIPKTIVDFLYSFFNSSTQAAGPPIAHTFAPPTGSTNIKRGVAQVAAEKPHALDILRMNNDLTSTPADSLLISALVNEITFSQVDHVLSVTVNLLGMDFNLNINSSDTVSDDWAEGANGELQFITALNCELNGTAVTLGDWTVSMKRAGINPAYQAVDPQSVVLGRFDFTASIQVPAEDAKAFWSNHRNDTTVQLEIFGPNANSDTMAAAGDFYIDLRGKLSKLTPNQGADEQFSAMEFIAGEPSDAVPACKVVVADALTHPTWTP